MLMRFDPFREMDQLLRQGHGAARAAWAPMDVYRRGDTVVAELDLPGVVPDTIDATVERDVLQVTAERRARHAEDDEVLLAERPQGTVTRQLYLGEALDTERIEASYDAGVLTLRIPVAEDAKPHKVPITAGEGQKAVTASTA